MNKMQKEYLKKLFIGIGLFLWAVAIIVSAALGEPWLWFAIGSTGAIAIPMVFVVLYIPIATQVWHWRLMGICEEEWQSKLLSRWWFWMYRSEKWFDYLKENIEDDFGDDEVVKQKATDFLYALNRVKKPKLL